MQVFISGSIEEIKELLSKFQNGLEKIEKHTIAVSDFLIPKFDWDKNKEKNYKTLFFFEYEDGTVMLSYQNSKTFTTKQKVMTLPYPVPDGYPPLKTIPSTNKRTAIRLYREYLVQQTALTVEKLDPDAKYKPKLKGAFSTRPGHEDYDKVEGDLQ